MTDDTPENLESSVVVPEGETSSKGGGASSQHYDINDSSPLEDIRTLLFSPTRFFSGIRESSHHLSRWAWGKGLFLFFFCQWLSYLEHSGVSSDFDFEFMVNEMSHRYSSDAFLLNLLSGDQLHVLKDKWAILKMLGQQFYVFVGPFLTLLGLYFFAQVTSWGMGLLIGKKDIVSRRALFLIFVFINCLAILKLAPMGGTVVVLVLGFLFTLKAVCAVYQVGYTQAFIGSYVFYNILMIAVFVGLGFFGLAVFLLSGMLLGSGALLSL